jgi:NAD(P)H-hydrate epimerase
MRALDRLTEEEFSLTSLQLMEAAGAQMAALARWWLGGVSDQPIAIVVGPGNNGADGLVAGRYLHNWGARARAWIAAPEEKLHALGVQQLRAARAAGMPVRRWSGQAIEGDVLVVDALLGTGLIRAPQGELAEAIEALTGRSPCLSLDVPSGLGHDGTVYQPCVAPSGTLTLGLPKPGLKAHGGRTFVADIGLPRALAARLGRDWNDLFAHSSIVELT